MSQAAENLLRAFAKNRAALEALVSEATIDLNVLDALVSARTDLIAEIADAGLDEGAIRRLHNEHKDLERRVVAARDAAAAQLSRMAGGKRVLGKYRS